MMRSRESVALGGRDYGAAALLALAIAAGSAVRIVPGVVGVVDDDAIYAVTAKALADGQGYHLVNLPGAPAQTKYPILYPAMIAPASATGSTLEGSLVAMQWATAALGALAMALAYLYCVRFAIAGRAAAFGACLLVASSPNVLFYCVQTLSEMPFLLLLVASLWATELRLRASDRSPARDYACGILLGLLPLCRTAGVIVPVTAMAILLLSRKPVRWVAAGTAIAVLPWLAWVAIASQAAGDGAIAYHTDYSRSWRNNLSAAVPAYNILYASLTFAHAELEALSRELYSRVEAAKWILAAIGALPWAAVLWRSRRGELLPPVLLTYLVLLCAFPWPPDRYLVPVLPFLTAIAFEQILGLLPKRGSKHSWRILLTGALAAAVAANGWMLSRYAEEGRESGYPYFAIGVEPVQWAHYRQAFDWLRDHTEPGDVLASGFDAMTSLYTGRPTIRPFVMWQAALFYGADGSAVGSVDEFARLLADHGVRYVLLTPMPAYAMEESVFGLVSGAVDTKPGLLKAVWQPKEDLRFVIFEVAQKPAGS